ncbi:MAG TPA: sulfatase-like hydrolase/transferase, partial [Terriglobales bacterium]|nr:sulfatase-like hydrolase/transferase [Terriglobales bacterium]
MWISTLVDVALYVGLALILAAASAVVPKLRFLPVAASIFTFVTMMDWCGLTARIAPLAVLALALAITVNVARWLRKNPARAHRFFFRSLPWVVAAAVLVGAGIEGTLRVREHLLTSRLQKVPANSPNVLVIVVDTLRADHLSLFGYPRLTSPHIDAFARQGVLFDNAISTASWTLPSHASMLTGLYPHEHGLQNDGALDNRHRTLPEAMAALGYRTGGFSANTGYFSQRTGLARGFLHFEDYFYSPGDMIRRTLWGRV